MLEQDRVSGIVDYGALGSDFRGVDLARLLGDLPSLDQDHFRAGLRAYRNTGGALPVPDEFVFVLASTGSLCSAIGWLRRLARPQQLFQAQTAIAERLSWVLQALKSSISTLLLGHPK